MAETLYSNGPDGKSLTPTLATGYTVSSDKTKWTFRCARREVLRRRADDRQGRGVLARRGRATRRMLLTSSTPRSSPCRRPDDHTVVVTTKTPWAPLLADLALVRQRDRAGQLRRQDRDGQFYSTRSAPGRSSSQSWVRGQYVKLVKNPYYWQQGKPYLDSVTFTRDRPMPTRGWPSSRAGRRRSSSRPLLPARRR